MSLSAYGDPIHGELIDKNINGGTYPVILYDSATATVRTLLATEFLTITDLSLAYAPGQGGGVFDFVMDTAVAGRHIFTGKAWQKFVVFRHFDTPITCPRGITPSIIMAAGGSVELILTGYITKA